MTVSDKYLLKIENLSVHLPATNGTVLAVDRVSLSLERGKTLAIVGESGSGKSMLCRAILDLLPRRALLPGPGRIIFNGRDLQETPARELAAIRGREIGIVLQNPMSSLNPVLTIGKQIAEPLRFHMGMGADQARERAIDLLRSAGISKPEQLVDYHPHQLSGGMRQRVAIAIALACDPKLLIADEPTTALDLTVQAEILNLLTRLQTERNMSMILVTHDLGVVAGRAHDTAVMYAGQIVEQAPTVELFDRMRMRYTKALFDAIPRLDNPPHHPLKAIGGQPPNLAALPEGCRFAPRCERAEQRCTEEEPELAADTRADHHYACWFPCNGEERA